MHWLVIIVLLAGGVIPARAAENGKSPALCGVNDRPETGIQGDVPLADQQSGRADEGYNCGLAVVGHNDFGGQQSGDMAWSGRCAYVHGDGGIRVVDVSDPTHPVLARVVSTTGGVENLHAVTTGERAVLVNGSSVYDVRDCLNPVPLGLIAWPDILVAHNASVSPDAMKLYASFGVQEANITDLYHPDTWTARNFACDVLAQYHPLYMDRTLCEANPVREQMSHEMELNKSGTRLYIAGQQPQPYSTVMLILDLTADPPKLISSVPDLPGHSIRRARIGGREFLLHSDETAPGIPQNAERRANGCLVDATPFAGAAYPYLTDISDETAPITISRLGLAINKQEPEFCAAAVSSSVNSTSHYLDVDDPDDSTFAMLPMKNGGLRIFDIRNPQAPIEVAYFNPAQYRANDGSTVLDRARQHPHYQASTGRIWLTTESHGFYVLELEPQVRTALNLPEPSGPLAIALAAVLIVCLRPKSSRLGGLERLHGRPGSWVEASAPWANSRLSVIA